MVSSVKKREFCDIMNMELAWFIYIACDSMTNLKPADILRKNIVSFVCSWLGFLNRNGESSRRSKQGGCMRTQIPYPAR